MKRILASTLTALLLIVSLTACQSGGEDDGELVVYSGRSRVLVDSLVEMYRQKSDAEVSVRYGTDSQLLSALKEEGDQSDADVFWANTAGALGNAAKNDMLTPLPDTLTAIPDRFSPSSGSWVPVTARFRVMAYNTERVGSTELPASVVGLPDASQFDGRIGWTPTYSSFQDFVTALRVTEGTDVARTWLEEMKALNPKSYASNTPMIQALAAGEIDVALTNHYYVLRLKHGDAKSDDANVSPSAPVGTYHFADGDVGNLALVTGAGILETNDQSEAAQDFLRFLLSQEAQVYAASVVNEYPVIQETDVPPYLMAPDQALRLSPQFDFERLREHEETIDLLRDVGLI